MSDSIEIATVVDTEELVKTALRFCGKVNITKDNPVMEIPIKGKLILHFNSDVSENQIIKIEMSL